MRIIQSRRRFLASASLASAAGLIGAPKSLHAEPPPETTSVRLQGYYNISDCQAPEYSADELMRVEGFTDIQLVDTGTGPASADWLAIGEFDFDWNCPTAHARSIEAGAAITVLAGLHTGCLELIARDGINNVADL